MPKLLRRVTLIGTCLGLVTLGAFSEGLVNLPGFALEKIKPLAAPKIDIALSLSLASTEQICEELLTRYEHIAIAGLREGPGTDSLIELRYQKGNSRTVQGLLWGMALRIERDIDNRRHPTEEKD